MDKWAQVETETAGWASELGLHPISWKKWPVSRGQALERTGKPSHCPSRGKPASREEGHRGSLGSNREPVLPSFSLLTHTSILACPTYPPLSILHAAIGNYHCHVDCYASDTLPGPGMGSASRSLGHTGGRHQLFSVYFPKRLVQKG